MEHKLKRFTWAVEHINWTEERWKSVIWSDESTYIVSADDSCGRVLGKVDEFFLERCVQGTYRFDKVFVMIWGAPGSVVWALLFPLTVPWTKTGTSTSWPGIYTRGWKVGFKKSLVSILFFQEDDAVAIQVRMPSCGMLKRAAPLLHSVRPDVQI